MDVSGASLSPAALYAWFGAAMPPSAGPAGVAGAVAVEKQALDASQELAAQLISSMMNAVPAVSLDAAMASLARLDPAMELARMG